ncbi:hypothetical protein [Eggerthella lenta]|uniref:hypothetical protein n=1 Tax=Eggerthella lenta TaxID=84112 RepID=UPI0036F3D401
MDDFAEGRRSVDEDKEARLSYRVAPALYRDVESKAAMLGMNISDFNRKLLSIALDEGLWRRLEPGYTPPEEPEGTHAQIAELLTNATEAISKQISSLEGELHSVSLRLDEHIRHDRALANRSMAQAAGHAASAVTAKRLEEELGSVADRIIAAQGQQVEEAFATHIRSPYSEDLYAVRTLGIPEDADDREILEFAGRSLLGLNAISHKVVSLFEDSYAATERVHSSQLEIEEQLSEVKAAARAMEDTLDSLLSALATYPIGPDDGDIDDAAAANANSCQGPSTADGGGYAPDAEGDGRAQAAEAAWSDDGWDPVYEEPCYGEYYA